MRCYSDGVEFKTLVGKTLSTISVNDDNDQITFKCDDGSCFLMQHFQECCETVSIEEVVGDFNDLVGSPILHAEEASQTGDIDDGNFEQCSGTWTFYKLATISGSVTIRWCGRSNGYYSEKVELCPIEVRSDEM